MIYRLAKRYVRWSDERADRRARAEQMRLFPPGTRVRVNGDCCERRERGRLGTIEGPTSLTTDWWVQLDGDDSAKTICCANGMDRL